MLILTIYDIIFSSIAVSFSLIYIIIDHLNIFQSNKFIHLPIGIFFDNRIIFQPLWTIDTSMLLYLHLILNSLALICLLLLNIINHIEVSEDFLFENLIYIFF